MPAPLPAGYAIDTPPPKPPAGYKLEATTNAHDGDTFALTDGRNARLLGVDAFELKQPFGPAARAFLQDQLGRETRVSPTGAVTYGRPVVTLDANGRDVGGASVGQGLALPEPRYLAKDPARLADYVNMQRRAIGEERGAYAGQFQTPTDYRHQGAAAPMRGKLAMTPVQAAEYRALLSDPKTNEAGLTAWFQRQGQNVANARNILSFVRENPKARPSYYFQTPDALGNPVPNAKAPVGTIEAPGFLDRAGALWSRGVNAVESGLYDVGGVLNDWSANTPLPWLSAEANARNRADDVRRASDLRAKAVTLRDSSRAPIEGETTWADVKADPWRAGSFVVDQGIGSVPAFGATVLAPYAYGASRTGEIARDRVENNAKPTLDELVSGNIAPRNPTMGDLAVAAPFAAVDVALGRFGVKGAAPVAGNLLRSTAVAGAKGSAMMGGQAVSDYAGTNLGTERGFNFSEAGDRAIAGVVGGFPVLAGAHLGTSALARRGGAPVPPEGYRVDGASVTDAPFRQQYAREAGGPELPPAAASDVPQRVTVAAMADGIEMPSISAPTRVVDRIDVAAPPISYALDAPLSGKARPMAERPTPEAMANATRDIRPDDVTPIPDNAVSGPDEAARIGAGMRPLVPEIDERTVLPPQNARTANGAMVRRRGPVDLVSFLRQSGGIKDNGPTSGLRAGMPGDLGHLGIGNDPRPLDFARNENFLGKLVDPDNGMALDDAAFTAWEAGYFPHLADRPTINEFLDALAETHRGGPRRVFHPDDYPAVDAYYSAQRQRGEVVQAADAGAPLVEDRGQPVGPDDLEANRPPATAYEDLPTVGGKVANINLAHIETPQDIRRALQTTETAFGGFDASRRGMISHAETEALASELGMTPADLLKRRKGQALNAEEALAARQLLAKSSNEVVSLASRAKGGSEADLAAFQEAMLRHAAIYEQATGAAAEAGRALSQFRMAAKSSAVSGRIHKLQVEQAGGRDSLEDLAGAIIDLAKVGEGPGQVTKFAVDALKPKFRDKLVELWYNSLLSGPQTHVVNIVSNTMTAALQVPEHAGAALLGGARRAVGLGDPDRVLFSEVGARAFGMMQGARDGLRAFAATAKTGVVPDHVTKVEAATQEAIGGLKGKIIRTPTRLLSAEDELFKAVARRSNMAGLAVRQARMEGLKGSDLKARIGDLLAYPSDDMVEATLDYARYVTFQRPVAGVAQAVSAATQKQPVLKLFIPFVRTPANILAYAAERSPLAPVVKTWRADVMAGGSRRDLALARAAMGTGLGALVTKLAADGLITGGGPADDNARDLMHADGWQPYSIRIGDRFYSYQRLDPLATTLGTAADLATKGDRMTEKQRNEAAGVITASILQNLSNKTWLSGMSDLVEMLHDPQRYAGSYVRKTAASIAVPALLAQTARSVDPVYREANTVADAIRERVPFASSSLMPRLDMFGRPVARPGGVGPDILSPFWVKTAEHNPVIGEVLDDGARFGDPSRDVGGVRLGDADWHRYRQAAGQGAYSAIARAMSGPEWATLPADERGDIVEKIKRDERKAARAALFSGDAKAALPALPAGYKADPLPNGYSLDH